MTFEQASSAGLLFGALVLFVWGRWRFDLVALTALVVGVLLGVIPYDKAFLGFSHPAVVTVIAVLVLSRAIANSGVIDDLAARLAPEGGPVTIQVGAFCALAATLSAFMNNVGALALLMPAVIGVAARSKRSPSLFLMPLAFTSMLGGLITLVGTPPNVIVAAYRGQVAEAPFSMFSFAPVGLAITLAGIIFVVLVGWRLIPARSKAGRNELFAIEGYITEASVKEDSPAIGKRLTEVEEMLGDIDAKIIGVIRGERRIPVGSVWESLREKDILVIEAAPDAIQAVLDKVDLELVGNERPVETGDEHELALVEAVVQPRTLLEGVTLEELHLRRRYGVNLLAVARQGQPYRGRLRNFRFAPGDVLLLQGAEDRITAALSMFGCLPLASRALSLGRPRRTLETMAIALGGLAAAAFGVLPVAIALTAAVTLLLVRGILPLREAYGAIDWPIVLLLGCMIPVGGTLESTGLTQLLAQGLLANAGGLSPVWVLAALLVVTMTLSDVVNNAATAVMMAPIGASLANGLGVSVDPFLMAVAVGASCAFLTPIGHQNNTLVMGPGGYRFGDYWRMGLPLEIIVVVVAVPAILFIWPL